MFQDKLTRWAFILMALSGIVSSLRAPDQVTAFATSLLPLIFFTIFSFGRFGIFRPVAFLKAVVIGCGTLGFVVIVSKLLKLEVSIGDIAILTQFSTPTSRGNVLGMANNGLAALMEAGVIGGLALSIMSGTRHRGVYAIAGATSLIGILLTFSRGSFMGVTGALFVFILLSTLLSTSHVRRLWFVVMLGIAVSITSFSFVPATKDRIMSIVDFQQHTARTGIWEGTLAMIKDAPIFGSGPGNFGKVYPDYNPPHITYRFQSPHSQYLYVLSGWGLVGGIIYFGFLGTAVIKPLLRHRHPMQVVAFSMMIAFWIHVVVEDLFIPHIGLIMGCIANRRLLYGDFSEENHIETVHDLED